MQFGAWVIRSLQGRWVMAKYVCSKGTYEVSVDGMTTRNGVKMRGMKLVGGVMLGAKLKEQNLDFTQGYTLTVKEVPEEKESLFFLPTKLEDREGGWERMDVFHIFISRGLYDELRQKGVHVASSAIKEVSQDEDVMDEEWPE